MTDETNRADEATPNRGRRREPETIEAAPIDAPAADASRPAARAAMSRPLLLAAAPGIAALLLAGVAFFAALDPGSDAERLASFAGRLDRIERRVSAIEARPVADLGPVQARLAEVDAKAASALEQANRRPEPPVVDLSPVEKRLAALESRPAFDPAPLEARLAQAEQALAQMRDALAAPKTEVRATQSPNVETGGAGGSSAAVALVADALGQKINRGAPYERELAALEKLGLPADQLAPLRPLASTGAPTGAALAQSFAQVSGAMLRAARGPAPENATWLERLQRSAASLVRVRPEGESGGEDAPALIGRVDAALKRNDAPGALALYDRLPAAAKEPARDWERLARSSAEAAAAARAVQDAAIARLAQN